MLILTHRVLLGQEQSRRLGAKYYKDELSRSDRIVVVCVNVLVSKIKSLNEEWQVIIMDEADLVSKHMVNDTMKSFKWQANRYLTALLRRCWICVVCQAEMPEQCVEHIACQMEIDTTKRDHLKCLKVVKPKASIPIQHCQNQMHIIQFMIHQYVSSMAPIKEGRSHNDSLEGPIYDSNLAGTCDFTIDDLYSGEPLSKVKVPKPRPTKAAETASRYGDDTNDGAGSSPPPRYVDFDDTQSTGDSTLSTSQRVGTDNSSSRVNEQKPTSACSMPVVVFCNKKEQCIVLGEMFKRIAVLAGADPSRILVITADTKNCDGLESHFCKDPNRYACKVDVLFATSVLGAGLSIDTHFVNTFVMYLNRITTVTEGTQLAARVR